MNGPSPAREATTLGAVRRPDTLFVAVLAAGILATTGCSDPQPPRPTPPTSKATGSGWTARAAAPIQRTEVAAGVLGGRIWVLGGFTDAGHPAAEVAIYDPASDKWTSGPALPEPVHHGSAAGDGSRLWVAGGYVGHGSSQKPTDAVRVIDSATGAWTNGPALPSPRGAGALAWDGRRLLFGGGVGPDGLAGDVFALEGDRWRRIGALSPAREHLAAASDGAGSTWFLAGRLGGLDTNRADVDLANGDRVTRIGEIPTPRGGVAGFHLPGVGGCVAGGEQNEGTFSQVECVAPDGAATVLPSLGAGRHGLGAVVVDGVAYTLLGGPTPGLSVTNAIEALPSSG